MRIVILGAGTVGSSIAELLCRNPKHVITVVDNNAAKTRQLNEELDVRALTGSASESTTLFQADVIGSDVVLAVTGVDEVNLVSASLSKAMGANRAIARVFDPVFRDRSTFDYQRHFRIDRLLSLEHLAALEFARGIRNPGSLAVETLARGELEVQEWRVQPKTAASGTALKELQLPSGVRVGSIVRKRKTWIAGADDVLEEGDRVTVIGRREAIDEVKPLFQKSQVKKKNVVIAGGGETGYHLARLLEGFRFSVKVIDIDDTRCAFLAHNLKSATVVKANATRRNVLEEERVAAADVFVACMGDDEENIMASVEARELGTKSVMAIVGRPDYANVVGKLGIDLVVSPREVMAKQVMSLLNTGPLVSRFNLADSSVSVLEIEVRDGAPVTEHVLANLRLPPHCLLAALTREDFVSVPGGDDRLKPGDIVIALVDEASADQLITLFEMSA
jgi:trk system potassium uptake protein TrkA